MRAVEDVIAIDGLLDLQAAVLRLCVADLCLGPRRGGQHYYTARRYLDRAGLLERIEAHYQLEHLDGPEQLALLDV